MSGDSDEKPVLLQPIWPLLAGLRDRRHGGAGVLSHDSDGERGMGAANGAGLYVF